MSKPRMRVVMIMGTASVYFEQVYGRIESKAGMRRMDRMALLHTGHGGRRPNHRHDLRKVEMAWCVRRR